MARELTNVKETMLTDAEVLASLSELYSPGELSQVLARILRMPEVWHQLHEPGFLERIDRKDSASTTLPNKIASLALNVPSLEWASRSSLGENEDRLNQLWRQAEDGTLIEGDCEIYALLAIGLLRECLKDQGQEKIVRFALHAPEIWSSPLTYAWPELNTRDRLISSLITEGGTKGIALVSQIALANYSPHESARLILANVPNAFDKILLGLQELEERELLEAITKIASSESAPLETSPSSDSIDRILAKAVRNLILGDVENAQLALDSAWEVATHNTGAVADLVADIARVDGDAIVELEARQQALRSHPTPIRRAELGIALIKQEKAEEALAILTDNPETTEEKIAFGLALTHLGEKVQASEVLRRVTHQLPNVEDLDNRYLNNLVGGLVSLGETEHALQATRLLVQRIPTSIEARIQLSSLLEQAGDPESAAEEANIALALEPDSKTARYALASSLQASERAEDALPHWQTLADHNVDVLTKLAYCALEANQVDLTRDTANRIIQNDPKSLDGQIIFGKALAAMGNYESAKNYFDKAIQIEPQDPNAWIALAECQVAVGDDQEAGATLTAGTQASPNSGHLQFELSRWLRRRGRLNEALEAIKQATNLDRKQAKWLVEYGDLLRELGHYNDALSVLQEAFAIQPKNWGTRQALAHVLEHLDDIKEAARLMHTLPDDASTEAHLLAGRILAKSIDQDGNTSVERVVFHLERARANGCEDTSNDYWIGLANENAGQVDEAFLAYQACLSQLSNDDRELRLQAVLGLARTALATDLTSLALSTLEDERQQFPTSIDLLVLLSEAYLAAQLPEQALRTSQQAMELDPCSLEALRVLVRAAIESGDYQEAIRASEELLDTNPEDTNAWLDLAVISQKAGEITSSRSALAQALRYGRHLPDVLQRTASILMDLDEKAAAQRMLQRASNLLPENIEVHQELADLSKELGDLETAQQAWRRCIEIQPENHAVYKNAAQALWELNRRSAAIGLWQRAASLQPDDAVLQSTLARAYLANGEPKRALNHYEIALGLEPGDAGLNYEAGEAALRHGACDKALGMLQKASHLAPEDLESLIALGECYLVLNRPHQARDILEKVTNAVSPPQRAFSLITIASLDIGDLSAAKSALESANQIAPASMADAIWFSRASTHMGDWRQSVTALEDWLSIENHPDAVLEFIHARLRIFDASWIYAIASESINHAPDPDLTDEKARQEIRTWIDDCRQAGITKNRIDKLSLWSSVSEGKLGEDPHTLAKTISKVEATAEIIQSAAIAYLRKNRPNDSQGILRSFREVKDADSWSALLLGLSHAAIGQHARARHAYQGAMVNPVIRPIASFHSALAWEAEGSVKKAIARLNNVLATWTDEPIWHFKLGSLYEDEGELDNALPHFQRAAELVPDEADFQLALARILREVGQLVDAERVYSEALKALPDDGQVWKEAGQVALSIGNAKTADSWFERACTLSPADAHCLIGSAHAALALGQDRQAMERAQAALRLTPDDFEVLLGMGKIFATQGKYEKALDVYEKALAHAANPLDVHLARGKLLIQIGQAEQAEAGLREALEANPDDHRAWAALAEACEAANHLEAGLDASSHAVRHSPRDATYRLQLGRLSRIAGQLDRALDEIVQAQQISPSDHRLALELGKIHEARREDEQALHAYTQAISLNPNCDEAHFRAGLVLKHLKAYKQAASMIERAVELNPKDPKVLHQLAAVRALELVHGGTLNSVVPS
jgi:tetratricopeptide (TPR) repeat protein